jgi:DNA-binding transcriptional LysR family regulator
MNPYDALQTFVAVIKEGSFAGAARALGITRAYVSRAMGELEEELSVQLFRRTTRSLSPTEEALLLYERALPLLQQWDDVMGSLAPEEELRGKIRMAAPRNYGEERVVPVLGEFLSQHPGVEVDLVLGDRRVALIEDGFDLAIRIASRRDASHRYRHLEDCPLHLYATPSYLEKSSPLATLEDLTNHRIVVDSNLDAGARWPLVVDGDRRVVTVQPSLRVNSPMAAYRAVACGLGVGMMTSWHVSDAVARGELVRVLEHATVDLFFDIHVIYPEGRYTAPRVRALIEHLTGALGA